MTRSFSARMTGRALLCALAGLVALPALAQANATLPGQNGRIAFASDRSNPTETEEPDLVTRGNVANCGNAPSGDNDCGFEIYTINPDGSGILRLTTNNSKDDKPSWSPDGTQIAFESRRDCEDDESDFCLADIYVMNADGTNQRQVTDGPESDTHPTWSPDGRTLAFERGEPDNGDPDRIYTVPSDGTPANTPQIVTTTDDDAVSDLLPAWSPDGSRIAFTRQTGSEPTPTLGALESSTADLSTRGEQAFSIHTYVVSASGGEPTPVGDPDECTEDELFFETCNLDFNPAWSPDGSRLSYHRLRIGGDQGIVKGFRELPVDDADIVSSAPDATASGFQNLTDEGDCSSGEQAGLQRGDPVCIDDYKPAYSPDSSRIAFHSDRGAPGCNADAQGPTDDSDCRPQLYTMASGGGAVAGPLAAVAGATDRNADWQRVIPAVVTPTPAPPVARDTRRPRVSVAGLRARGCTASRRLRVPIRIAERGGIRSVTVSLDGRRLVRTRRARFTVTINARRLRPGRHRVRVVAVDGSGNRTTVDRRFARCAQRVAPTLTG